MASATAPCIGGKAAPPATPMTRRADARLASAPVFEVAVVKMVGYLVKKEREKERRRCCQFESMSLQAHLTLMYSHGRLEEEDSEQHVDSSTSVTDGHTDHESRGQQTVGSEKDSWLDDLEKSGRDEPGDHEGDLHVSEQSRGFLGGEWVLAFSSQVEHERGSGDLSSNVEKLSDETQGGVMTFPKRLL